MESLKWRVTAKVTDSQPKVRMPIEMWQRLKELAAERGRTFNNEVLVRLAKTLYEEDTGVKK